MRTAGNVVVPEVEKPSTMLLPNRPKVPRCWRSGEIAPLKAEYAVLVAFPDWNSVRATGLISYQRTSDRPRSARVVCWTHSPSLARAGSQAEIAGPGRASSVSSRFAEFGNPLLCGASGGTE